MKIIQAFTLCSLIGTNFAVAGEVNPLIELGVGHAIVDSKKVDVSGPIYSVKFGLEYDNLDLYFTNKNIVDRKNQYQWREVTDITQNGIGVRIKNDHKFLSFDIGMIKAPYHKIQDTEYWYRENKSTLGIYAGVTVGTKIFEHVNIEAGIQGLSVDNDKYSTISSFSVNLSL